MLINMILVHMWYTQTRKLEMELKINSNSINKIGINRIKQIIYKIIILIKVIK
jgi:hypothetical protein